MREKKLKNIVAIPAWAEAIFQIATFQRFLATRQTGLQNLHEKQLCNAMYLYTNYAEQ